jgi:hypothetical protein
VGHEDDQRQQAPLRPWPPPQDAIERLTRQRVLLRWEIVFLRVLLLLAADIGAAILVAGPSALSLWREAGDELLAFAVLLPASWLVRARSRYWLLQLAGLRPPAGEASG